MALAVNVQNVSKTYEGGTQALRGASLQIEEGDFFALLGPNGAGKTTLIGILSGLVNKSGGTVSVFGIDVDTDVSGAKAMIGVVPQEFNFSIFEKVEDIVVSQAGYYGVPPEVARPRAEVILKDLGLWDKRRTPSRALSGGMKRRLMIARALCHHPKLLILDEPTAGVDVELRRGMWDYLRALNAAGTTILLTSHYLEDVEALCRRMAIIKDGQVLREDLVKNVLKATGKERYTLTVDKAVMGEGITVVDETTISVESDAKDGLAPVLAHLASLGMKVTDVRPNTNRLEQLLLNVIQGTV